MTRQESQILKGIAILMMLYLHLFNLTENVVLCDTTYFFKRFAMVCRACDPVPFFLILSGYGLFKVWIKGDRNRYVRIGKLMLHYWVILTVFLIIGHFIYPGKYPGSLFSIIGNYTSYNTTYNGEMWFLFPFLILSLLAPGIFKIMCKFRTRYVLAATFIIYLSVNYFIIRHGNAYLYHNPTPINIIPFLYLLFDFSLGAMAARCSYFERIQCLIDKRIRNCKCLIWGGIAILFVLKIIVNFLAGYAFLLITLLLVAPRWVWLDEFLGKLGVHSMNIWMIHTWFCYYLFKSFIYAFQHPLLIFLVLVVISYISSILFNTMIKPIENAILPRFQIKVK